MAILSANLMAAWGDDEGSEPDPNKLPGALNLAEARLEESVDSFRTLLPHFEAIHRRVLEAQNNLKGMMAKAGELPAQLAEAAKENLESFEDIVPQLEDLLALEPDEEIDTYWEVLGSLEEASETLRAANLKLAEAANAAQN